MYSRSYYADEGRIQIPENYDGTSLMEKASDIREEVRRDEVMQNSTNDNGKFENTDKHSTADKFGFPKLFDRFRMPDGESPKNILRKIISNFGTEELIIIGVALFMLLSDDGDIECGGMLLFLLFIG
ncbi:MAG: hypothetical protein E7617_06565 [Ruminococcaceae bacterium]|nr:hypothetical protein [Oscillospiraceae bacterium]